MINIFLILSFGRCLVCETKTCFTSCKSQFFFFFSFFISFLSLSFTLNLNLRFLPSSRMVSFTIHLSLQPSHLWTLTSFSKCVATKRFSPSTILLLFFFLFPNCVLPSSLTTNINPQTNAYWYDETQIQNASEYVET